MPADWPGSDEVKYKCTDEKLCCSPNGIPGRAKPSIIILNKLSECYTHQNYHACPE
jgi:hypothetical protein